MAVADDANRTCSRPYPRPEKPRVALLRLAPRPFGDPRGPAGARAEVVELRAADGAAGCDLDPVDALRVHREDALDADAVGGLPHGEHLAAAAAAPADHRALEDLDALLVAL